MFEAASKDKQPITQQLAGRGYVPAIAAEYLADGKYSRAVEVCKEALDDEVGVVSLRLIYARALYHAGQRESAADQFYHVLTLDPDNLVALKYLGDIRFDEGDEATAFAHYRRVLEIDSGCRELCCPVKSEKAESAEATKTVTLKHGPETSPVATRTTSPAKNLREIPFYTETMGDLYLSQGHARLAAEVFRTLNERNPNPRLQEKLDKAEKRTTIKER